MNKWLFVMAVFLCFFTAGCTQQPSCDCPSPGSWSECNEQAIKTRTAYTCSADTNYTCVEYEEQKECSTYMEISNSDLLVVVSPTLDNVVKGTIKFEATSLPQNTQTIVFMLYPEGQPIDMNQGLKENQIFSSDDVSGSWVKYVDTTQLDNGVYMVGILPTNDNMPSNSPWLAVGQAQIIVRN